jgi:hypothetical protein
MPGDRMSDLIDFEFEEVPLAKTSDDYYTPKWIFEALGLEFDLDVSSPVGGISWIPAKRYFTQYDDGLAQDWNGQRVWMNPPYSNPSKWVAKWLENANGVCLVPMSKSKWFEVLWENCGGIVAMPANLKFVNGQSEKASIFMPVVLAAIGDENVSALKSSRIGFMR